MRGKILLAGAVALVGFAFTASSASAQVHNDHYACYQLKHKFPKGQTGTLNNQIERPCIFEVQAEALCVPTLKNGGGTSPTRTLTTPCSSARPASPSWPTPSRISSRWRRDDKEAKFMLNLATKANQEALKRQCLKGKGLRSFPFFYPPAWRADFGRRPSDTAPAP